MRGILTSFLLFLNLSITHAQEFLCPINRDMNIGLTPALMEDSTGFHTSLQPYVYPDLQMLKSYQALQRTDTMNSKFYSTWAGRKLFKEHLIEINSEGLKLSVDPLFNLQLGREQYSRKNIFLNTRGVLVKGDVNGKFFFYTSFYENQARYANYIDSLKIGRAHV